MSVDFDDPFAPRATIVRPRPGGGRRVPSESGVARVAPLLRESDPLTASLRDAMGRGLNPLVQAASPVLLLAAHLRQTPSHHDVAALRRQVLDEIRRFEDRARAAGAAAEVVRAGDYVLCAAIDEAVLSTPWGAHSDWARESLLVSRHGDASGGQKFFDMLERIAPDPTRHINLMELQYLCLAIGFAGKYQIAERGPARLAELQHSLYRKIRDYRGVPPTTLSLRWQGVQDQRNPVLRYVPWWVAAAAAVTVLAVTFVVLYTRLGYASAPVQAALATVGTEQFSGAAPPARAGLTLKQLLANEEAQHTVLVEEDGGRTTVTLLQPQLFASASDRLNDGAIPTVARIADAIRRVPGAVLVVGHTDDQPIQSIRFSDNYALSRARAERVAALLRADVDVASRIQVNGLGSTQPRYRPESSDDNRARNRRVEIVHVAAP
jgi:type VI secretion system protein ImpK